MDHKPPPWEDDPLSSYFSQAEFNDRVAALNYPHVFALLQDINAVFEAAQAAIEKDNQQVLLIPRMLLVRARSALLAALRLAMSGQIPEAFPVLRLAIELSWYALHIAKDSSPPSRAVVWLKRGDTPEDTQACKSEFTIKKVRTTNEEVDPSLAAHLRLQYEGMIDLGAHPNQLGLFSAFGLTENEKQVTYQIGILYPLEFPLLAAVGLSVGVALDVLKVFELIFPERFKIMGIDAKIGAALAKAQQLFANHKAVKPFFPEGTTA